MKTVSQCNKCHYLLSSGYCNKMYLPNKFKWPKTKTIGRGGAYINVFDGTKMYIPFQSVYQSPKIELKADVININNNCKEFKCMDGILHNIFMILIGVVIGNIRVKRVKK